MSDRTAPGGELLEQARVVTDELLQTCAVRLEAEHPGRLGQALGYALRGSGKRIRPALVLGSYRSVGGCSPGIAGVAAAVEIVHTYSLVHDDLPCMDDDDQRRGRATTHVAFDVPTATRVGWMLVPAAVEELCRAADALELGADVLGEMATTLLDAGGPGGMVGGQWLDLEAESRDTDLEQLAVIHRAKTGALIEACCVLGGLAGGAGARQREGLAAFGREIGLAFQITDDVLDATASSAELGKTTGRDVVLSKATYVSLLGVEGARAAAARHQEAALRALAEHGLEGTLADLADYIAGRTS